ncbi:unnamed protein product [Leptosia nina]|uniref:C2H2-type domain-containing protein n=1 Tax=Leptosia nina TaxID=320188 RepID=A0AAV1JRK9_9NEOP
MQLSKLKEYLRMSTNEDMFLVIIGDQDYQVPEDLKDVVEQSDSNMQDADLEEEEIDEETCNYEIQNEEEVRDEPFDFNTVEVVNEGIPEEENEVDSSDGITSSKQVPMATDEIVLDQPYEIELKEIKDNEETNDEQIIIEGLDENGVLQLENGQLQLPDGQHILIQQENGEYILQDSSNLNIIEINGEQVLVQQVDEADENQQDQSEAKDNDSDTEYRPSKEDLEISDDEFVTPKRRKEKPRSNPVTSYVQELKDTYPELNDEDKLISTLAKIMRSIEPPPLPDNFCAMNGMMFECSSCGKFFNSMPEAARHYQYYHGERYLICFACGADFRNPTNLYKHEKGCTVYPDIITVLKARSKHLSSKGRSRPYFSKSHEIRIENNRFLCSHCPASFTSRVGLDAHEHVHAGQRPYLCSYCVCAYTSPSALSRHMRKHRGDMFVCEHCGKRFHQRAALDTHMETHQPLRKFACSECPKRFAQKNALQLHVDRVHRDLPPPCACQLCPRRYPRMSLLKQHMKKAHGMLLMTQKMFYKSLPTLTQSQVDQAKVVLKSEVENYPKYEIHDLTET